MIEEAKALVKDYIDKHIENDGSDAGYSVFVVWQSFILGNFKCLISTTRPVGMYFELTYDREHGCWYFDVYQKVVNRVIDSGVH